MPRDRRKVDGWRRGEGHVKQTEARMCEPKSLVPTEAGEGKGDSAPEPCREPGPGDIWISDF